MDEPKTAAAHNAQFTGDFIAIETSQVTMPSGAAYQAAWEREKAHKARIRAVLVRYLQDETLIQQMVAELYRAETQP